MARITVEDCLDNVDNRFELVMLASKRARQMAIGGKDPLVEDDSDKAKFKSDSADKQKFIGAEDRALIEKHCAGFVDRLDASPYNVFS